MEYSDLDLLVSGHSDGVNMIEVGAAEVPDEDVLAAIKFGYEEGIKPLLELQQELMEKCGTTESAWATSTCLPTKSPRRSSCSR